MRRTRQTTFDRRSPFPSYACKTRLRACRLARTDADAAEVARARKHPVPYVLPHTGKRRLPQPRRARPSRTRPTMGAVSAVPPRRAATTLNAPRPIINGAAPSCTRETVGNHSCGNGARVRTGRSRQGGERRGDAIQIKSARAIRPSRPRPPQITQT